MYSSYQGGAFFVENNQIVQGRGRFRNNFAADQHFIFHRLSNFKAYAWVHEEKKFYSKFTFAGQYDIVKLLGNLYAALYQSRCTNCAFMWYINNMRGTTICADSARNIFLLTL